MPTLASRARSRIPPDARASSGRLPERTDAGLLESDFMLRVGLVGYGYWGPNLARNFSQNPDCRLVRIADMSPKRREIAAQAHAGVETVAEASAVTEAADIDVVVVATPVRFHYELSKAALLAGKHVWVEKPMTSTSEQARELTEIAGERGLVLMVDHTFIFTGAVRKMKELIDAGEMGDLYYYDSVRVNLGLFQSDVNVIWDLAPHDLSIMDFLLGPEARAVAAQGRSHFNTGLEDVAYMTVFYDRDLLAHFHVNWLSPVKIRQTLVGGSKNMLVWDDLSADEKIRIYSRGVEISTGEDRNRFLAEYRIGDMYCPRIANIEALKTEVAYFVECVREKKTPINDGEAGRRIVSILEAADRSLKSGGGRVDL